MEFDKRRVYTALNADELKAGDMVIVADCLKTLKERVASDYQSEKLLAVNDENEHYRFDVEKGACCLAYLVNPN